MEYRWERLNFSHLFYFYVTAKEGSIKAACEKLFISQPTVSDQIKLLEEFLECKLFERRNRALFLTKEGEVALDYADKLFSLSQEMIRRVRRGEKMPRASLDIGVTPFMSQYLLYSELTPFFENPKTMVNFIEGDKAYLLSLLEEEEIDVLLTSSKDGVSQQLVAHRVGTNRSYAVAHKKFKKHQKDFPYSLSQIPFFGHSTSSDLRYDIDMFFSQYGISSPKIGEGNSLELFEVICQKGLGFTIVTEAGKNRLCQNKDIIVLGELSEMETNVWAVVKKGVDNEAMPFVRLLKERN